MGYTKPCHMNMDSGHAPDPSIHPRRAQGDLSPRKTDPRVRQGWGSEHGVAGGSAATLQASSKQASKRQRAASPVCLSGRAGPKFGKTVSHPGNVD